MNPIERMPSQIEVAEVCAAVEMATRLRDIKCLESPPRPPLAEDIELLLGPVAFFAGILTVVFLGVLLGRFFK